MNKYWKKMRCKLEREREKKSYWFKKRHDESKIDDDVDDVIHVHIYKYMYI